MTGNRDLFQKAMNLGHTAVWEQKWEQAAASYRQAVEEIPDDPSALTSLGLALYELQDFNGALQYYLQAANFSPEDPMPLEKIGLIYKQQQKEPEAARYFVKSSELHLKTRNVEKSVENLIIALNLQPDYVMARSLLALIYERTGKKAEAVNEYLCVASVYQKNRDVEKAKQMIQHALEIMPDHVDAQQALYLLRNNQILPPPTRPRPLNGTLASSEIQPAVQSAIKSSKAVDPIIEGRQAALSQLAAILFEEGENLTSSGAATRKGITSITQGQGNVSSTQSEKTLITLHLGQAIELQSQSQEKKAAEELERAIELGLDSPSAHFDLGLLTHNTNSQKAVRHLLISVKQPVFALPSYLLLAKIAEAGRDYTNASAYYLQALRTADAETLPADQADDINQLYEPIIAAQSRQKDVEAQKKLCATIASQLNRPDWRQFLQTARQQITATTEGSAAIPLAEMLLESGSAQVVETMGNIRDLTRRKLYNSAMEEALTGLLVVPTYLPLHIQIGELLLHQGRTSEAITKFLLVAEAYSLRGEASQAIRLLTRVCNLVPMDLSVQGRLIELLVAQSRIDEAIEHYMYQAGIYYQLAELDLARQTYVAALKLAQKSQTDQVWNNQILYKIADIDLQRLDWHQAIRIFEQIRTIEPEDANARLQIVQLNFKLGQDHNAMTEIEGFTSSLENNEKKQKAIEFLENILQEQPQKLELRKRLADLYARNGQTEKAVVQLDMIARVFFESGNLRGASTIIQAIIALKPTNIEKYQRALANIQKR